MSTGKSNSGGIKRELQTRHISMIALGGSIGTGLFVASGSAISQAGPMGAIAAYAAIGIMVFFLMTSLGEMATYMPLTGSFATYATKFVDPAFGFAMGWNYWFNWAVTLAVDAATVGVVMSYWLPNWPQWIWSAIAIVLIFIVNILSVKSFGETEFWMSIIKVVTVLVFLVIGVLTIFGIMGNHVNVITNLTANHHNGGFVGGLPAVLAVFVVAGYSFQGTELIGITAGESATPEESVPKAIKQVFWRILLFYILSILVIAELINYKDPNLLRSDAAHVAISPFALVFKQAGFAAAASVMNAIILTSVLSSANSGMYASTRMLYVMSREGFAPKLFDRVSRRGIPLTALLGTTIVAILTFLTSVLGPNAYTYLVAGSGLTGFIAWIGIAVSHYRFRRAFVAQGHALTELKYKAKWFPFGPLLALIVCILVIIGQNPTSFIKFDWQQILITYMSIPLFLILFIYYKVRYKTHIISLTEVDLTKVTKSESFES
ncbi:amino acid permease [Periweissella fabalis]|uniref:Amino acid permease n=1 Tax=Periweissella fabalis TaxID=1070421 RepID=A0A7X6S435_9LACO|nr:amino acid permease [Periweissella fabalis]MCM0599711.1 amino acid permease [Periweissella fabalis]NKZ24876.1 amino acid permease [Periweissella fabalis]